MKKILLVDDDELILELMTATLGGDQYQVLWAKSGEEALEIVRKEKPSAVLLDVRLPGINGYGVCKALKEDPTTRHIKIVMLTGMTQDPDRGPATAAGADCFLQKPFSPTALLSELNALLDL